MRVCQFRHFGLSLLRTSEYSQKVCVQKSGRLSTPIFIVQAVSLLSNMEQKSGSRTSRAQKRRRVRLRLSDNAMVILY